MAGMLPTNLNVIYPGRLSQSSQRLIPKEFWRFLQWAQPLPRRLRLAARIALPLPTSDPLRNQAKTSPATTEDREVRGLVTHRRAPPSARFALGRRLGSALCRAQSSQRNRRSLNSLLPPRALDARKVRTQYPPSSAPRAAARYSDKSLPETHVALVVGSFTASCACSSF